MLSRKPLGCPEKKIDKDRIRVDYQALQSFRKVAQLHWCGKDLVREIARGTRVLKSRGQSPIKRNS